MADVYCVYINADKNTAQIYNGQDTVYKNDLRILDEINLSRKSICFVPSVKIICRLFPGGELHEDEEYAKNGDSDYLTYNYGNIEFRSFGALINMQTASSILTMFNTDSTAEAMYLYLCELGDPIKVKYTLAYQAKKEFYKGIEDELWEERKKLKKFYYDMETYNDMMAGVKSGVLSDYTAKYFENVIRYDIKSAYASIMVTDNKFPVGKLKKINCGDYQYKITVIQRCMRKEEWVKVVIDGKMESFNRWYDKKYDKTALEFYNLKTLDLIGILDEFYSKLQGREFTVYTSNKTDYLNELVRDRIIERYDLKESLPKNSVRRYLVKTQIEVLCGKGIQDHSFDNIKDVQNHYRGKGHGSNYMCPEMSMHCIAAIEYELYNAIANCDTKYFDTDGVSVDYNDETKRYFDKRNQEIRKRNLEAGYDTSIGVWDCEGKVDRMLVFTPKIYIYESNGNIIFKAAGVDKEYREQIINALGSNAINYMRLNGFTTLAKKYLIDCGKLKVIFVPGHLSGDIQKG